MIGYPAYGDAILDRLVHYAHRLPLTGGSRMPRSTTPPSSASLPA
jgi:hypothetical protein